LTNHLVIPDVQAEANTPTKHLKACGNFIVEHRPEVIVQIGDFADLPSLCSYDRGTKGFDSRSFKLDVDAAKSAMADLLGPLHKLQARQRKAHKEVYKPKMVLTLGNHEVRLEKALKTELSRLEGLISMDSLGYKDFGWEVVPFLKYKMIDGVTYVHYVMNDFSGTAKTSMKTAVDKIMGSVTVGHRQTLDIHVKPDPKTGRSVWGICAGAFYMHDEDYKGEQGNIHWRGIIHKRDVSKGDFNPEFIKMDHLLDNYS
jgi:hypothetical protein